MTTDTEGNVDPVGQKGPHQIAANSRSAQTADYKIFYLGNINFRGISAFLRSENLPATGRKFDNFFVHALLIVFCF